MVVYVCRYFWSSRSLAQPPPPSIPRSVCPLWAFSAMAEKFLPVHHRVVSLFLCQWARPPLSWAQTCGISEFGTKSVWLLDFVSQARLQCRGFTALGCALQASVPAPLLNFQLLHRIPGPSDFAKSYFFSATHCWLGCPSSWT